MDLSSSSETARSSLRMACEDPFSGPSVAFFSFALGVAFCDSHDPHHFVAFRTHFDPAFFALSHLSLVSLLLRPFSNTQA